MENRAFWDGCFPPGHGEAKEIARKLLKLLRFLHAEALVAGDFDEMAELLKRHLG